ncbi:DUF3597 domain-containing protein [Lichenicola sp.]|uniref:DUF3597 domain-containing protein n=1 Tax=Lichenicola sp. TaxID=2804529 RepID=UPI003B002B7D
MSFFGSIVDKIVHYATSALDPSAAATTTPSAPSQATAATPVADAAGAATSGQTAAPAAASAAPLQSVDIGAVLSGLAAQKGETLNWQTSIVDLLKLLDLDSSLSARKSLAEELGVHAGADGSAEENIALHHAVVQKLEENGGTVPASMKG